MRSGQRFYPWTTSRTVDLGRGQVSHSFLVIPECPTPLLGRDLLTKLKAQIKFTQKGPVVSWDTPSTLTLTLRLEEEYRMHEQKETQQHSKVQDWLTKFPKAWAETGLMGKAVKGPLSWDTTVSHEPGSQGRHQTTHTETVRTRHSGSMPIPMEHPTPVKKPGTDDYRPVQDLREVNKRVQDIHPTVPNPYNLLSSLPPERAWYSVLDLKPGTNDYRMPSSVSGYIPPASLSLLLNGET